MNPLAIDYSSHKKDNSIDIIVYNVIIHRNEDADGYWAECVSLPGCFTDGDTIQETQRNMYEAVNLFFMDEPYDTPEYFLKFEVAHA